MLAPVSSFCRSSRYGYANRNHLSPILARGPQPRMPPLYQRTATLYYKWETRSHADDPRAEPLPAWRNPTRGSRRVITAAYVEERLARAREGRRRPGVRDARCCHASGAPVMPAWRHSATHARTGAEDAGAVVRRPAQSARRGYHRLDRWSEEGGGGDAAELGEEDRARRGTHSRRRRAGRTLRTDGADSRDMPTRHGGGEVASKLQPRTTHTHTHTHTLHHRDNERGI